MKPKYYHMHAYAVDADGDNHVVTVVGKLEQKRVSKDVELPSTVTVQEKYGKRIVDGTSRFKRKVLERTLTIGVSICHPTDEFNEEYGVELAKKRIERGDDAGSVTTNDATMLTKDLVQLEILGKLMYITKNVDKFIYKNLKTWI